MTGGATLQTIQMTNIITFVSGSHWNYAIVLVEANRAHGV